MITIRRAQMQEFGKSTMRNFIRNAVSHLEAYFPEQCSALGQDAVVDPVRYGVDRATQYHLESEQDLLRYLTLMFSFGKDFDVDPSFPWATAILTGEDAPEAKTNSLQERARNNRNLGQGYRISPVPLSRKEGN